MRARASAQQARRAREFEAFVAGAAGRLLHAATLLTSELPEDNPRARRLLTAALARTFASWDRLRGDDPYDRARQELATRFAYMGWLSHRGHGGLLSRLSPRERLILVMRLYEGVAEEQTAAQLGLSVERVHTICRRAMSVLLSAPAGGPAAKQVRAPKPEAPAPETPAPEASTPDAPVEVASP